MIYIIDDKRSRQKDFGWDKMRFGLYSKNIVPIWSIEELRELQETILHEGNTILFHESFCSSEEANTRDIIKAFKSDLRDKSETLYITYFSGSMGARYVGNNRCNLPPDILYSNLEIFINKLIEGDHNFKYLAFGENFEIEESLRDRLDQINDDNIGGEKISVSNTIFFATTSDDTEVEPPFDNIDIKRDWDLNFRDNPISDQDLDKLVMDWFMETKYDAIYIPLCFGKILSDFMGLRLAMHIRLTSTSNQLTPVFIYGVAAHEEIKQNYCFDILKTSTVRLISCDNDSFIRSTQIGLSECNIAKEIGFIHLDMPSNIGGHSLANQWGAEALARATNLKYDIPIEVQESKKTLYFKYALLKSQFSKFDESDSMDSTKTKNIESKGKRILLIDDEADKGWEQIVKALFINAYLDVIKGKISNFDELPEKYIKRIEEDFYDLYLLDLRLQGENEEDIVQTDKFSGMEILDAIKQINPGNQVIMMTASNKAWNMKKLIDKGANGYYIKEDPELMLPLAFSQENYLSFKKDIETAYKNVYKRDLWAKLYKLFEYIEKSTIDEELKDVLNRQLEIFEQLMIKATNRDEIASVFFTLFQVFDAIKQYYSKEMLFTTMSIPDNIKHIVDDKGKKRMNNTLFRELRDVNKARKNYVHKLHDTCDIDYKSVEGLRKLLHVVSEIIYVL